MTEHTSRQPAAATNEAPLLPPGEQELGNQGATGAQIPAGHPTHGSLVAHGVRLHYVEQGRGPLVVLLHGFPECWYSWRHQLPALAAAGFRAVALDLRGYGQSERPSGLRHSTVATVAGDVAAVIDRLGRGEPAAGVIGHDWGGGIAWIAAQRFPHRMRRLVVINCPHPLALARVWRQPALLWRLWYIAFFQLPWLPEAVIRAGRFALVEAAFAPARARNPAAVTLADIDYLRRELARPGALTAALAYYRALPLSAFRLGSRMLEPIAVPSLVIWGTRDPYLGEAFLETAAQWAQPVEVVRLIGAGHFCHQEEPDRVNRLLVSWLAGASPGTAG